MQTRDTTVGAHQEQPEEQGHCAMYPCRKSTKSSGDISYKKHSSVRYVVERFFSWPKSGFHRAVIRYERMWQLSWVCLLGIDCDVFESIGMS